MPNRCASAKAWRDLDDLAVGVLGAVVDGGSDTDRTQVEGLAHAAEHHLVVGVGVVEKVVVIELDDERDAVGVAARDDAEAAEGGGDGVAVAGNGQVTQSGRVEVGRVLGEGGSRRVLDALIDREDREVAGAGQAAGVVHVAQVAQDGRCAVGVDEDPVERLGTGDVQQIGVERRRDVGQQRFGLVAQEFLDIHGGEPIGRRGFPSSPGAACSPVSAEDSGPNWASRSPTS